MAGMSLPAWRAEPSPTGPLPRILPAVMLALATMLCLGTAALFTPSTSPATYLTIFAFSGSFAFSHASAARPMSSAHCLGS